VKKSSFTYLLKAKKERIILDSSWYLIILHTILSVIHCDYMVFYSLPFYFLARCPATAMFIFPGSLQGPNTNHAISSLAPLLFHFQPAAKVGFPKAISVYITSSDENIAMALPELLIP
jgi:hypothetical protein